MFPLFIHNLINHEYNCTKVITIKVFTFLSLIIIKIIRRRKRENERLDHLTCWPSNHWLFDKCSSFNLKPFCSFPTEPFNEQKLEFHPLPLLAFLWPSCFKSSFCTQNSEHSPERKITTDNNNKSLWWSSCYKLNFFNTYSEMTFFLIFMFSFSDD